MSSDRDVDAASLIARIEDVPFSRWHIKARVVMGSATFFDAFNALSLAFVLPVLVRLWHITPKQTGVLIAASYVGQLAGALVFGWFAERLGRVPGAVMATAIMSVMSFGCAAAGNFPALFLCRLIQGIGVGGEMPIAAAYISELSQAHGRGRFFLLYELIFPIGLVATGQIGVWVVPALGWRSMFLIGGIPGLLVTFLLTRLTESPRWLISKGRLSKAEVIVKEIEASTDRRFSTSAGYGHPARVNKVIPSEGIKRGGWRELLSPFYRGRTLIVWVLWACSYFISNSLNNWLPSLYTTVYHLQLRKSLLAASMTNVTLLIVLLCCALVIDRIGRRNWTVACFVIGGVLLAILGFAGYQSVVGVMIWGTLSYGIVGSVNGVLYLYTPEVYPTRIRAIGTGLATSWLRLASAIGPTLVGVMVGARGMASVFLMFVGVSVVGALAASRMVETSDRRLEEIAP